MPKERVIATKFWTDNYVTVLDPIEKLLFLYFISNPLTNISGVYEIPLKQIGFDTGIDTDMVRKILDRFERDGKIFYRVGWVGIRNFIKNQHTESIDVQKGIKRELELAPVDIITATFGRDSIEGGGRVGGGSYILNLTKLNLTKPTGGALRPDTLEEEYTRLSQEKEIIDTDKPTKKEKDKRPLKILYKLAAKVKEVEGEDMVIENSQKPIAKALKYLTEEKLWEVLEDAVDNGELRKLKWNLYLLLSDPKINEYKIS